MSAGEAIRNDATRTAPATATDAAGAPRIIDARGMRCPLPSLRLARAVREGGPGAYLLLADDPAAATDVPALCAERGWSVTPGEGRYAVVA